MTAAKTPPLTVERLKQIFGYEPESGRLYWKERVSRRYKVGETAGRLVRHGYVRTRVLGVQMYAHRLAWLLTHGAWPIGMIDHINGIKTDNRIANLRDVSPAVNVQNVSIRAKQSCESGLVGAHKYKGGRWKSSIRANGVIHRLGVFSTPEEASRAYVEAKKFFHSEAMK